MYFNANVDGFYTSEAEFNNQISDGSYYNRISRGWNFLWNPLDVNHAGFSNRFDYYNHENQMNKNLMNNLNLRAKWYDYLDPLGLIVGTGNGLYYYKHRVR
jgi:hypothetical protein